MTGPEEASRTDAAGTAGRPRPVSVVLVLRGPISATDVPALCDRLDGMLRRSGAGLATCDVGGLADATVATVDALARLQLAARRAGAVIRLRHASPQLRALLDLVGLADVLPSGPTERHGA